MLRRGSTGWEKVPHPNVEGGLSERKPSLGSAKIKWESIRRRIQGARGRMAFQAKAHNIFVELEVHQCG